MRTINGIAVLEYGNHLPSFHEPPLGFAVRTTIPDRVGICKSSQNSVVRMDSHRFRIEMEFMLTTGFCLLTARKTARFCNWLRIPPCPQSTGRPGSGKRKTANDCRTPKRLRRYSLAIAIKRLFSFYLELPTH